MHCNFLGRALGRGVPALTLSAFIAASAAASSTDEFTVTPLQMQGLGIRLQRLDQPADIRGQAYPARVVLPHAQEQVVSAPLAGLVDQVLVNENDMVKRGQPLLRLISPDLGELQLRALEAGSKNRLSQKALQRERMLLAEGIVPERRVQEAEGNAEADRARLQQAEAALRLAGLDAASIQKLGAAGSLHDGLIVRAGKAGTVLALTAKPGQRVAQADALMRLADTRQLWLDIQLPADRRSQIAADGGQITVVGREVSAVALSLGSVVSDGRPSRCGHASTRAPRCCARVSMCRRKCRSRTEPVQGQLASVGPCPWRRSCARAARRTSSYAPPRAFSRKRSRCSTALAIRCRSKVRWRPDRTSPSPRSLP
ncbi:MAG: efflux RND transporter periplasmic adaptor subunit [Burkholderiaceae bacterium]|nr:efflux RND transporter periplasmic adaptor subunit [Burkholderiaceae bacterium]